MVYNSGILALLVSLCAAVSSSILVWLLAQDAGKATVAVTFIACLLASFGCTYFLLAKFVFGEIRNLHARFRELGVKTGSKESIDLHSLANLSADLSSFITEKQLEIERLKKLEAFRKDFIADVSHELKTPIFAAQGFVHTLLDGAVKEKGVRKKFLKRAAKSLDGLDMLVQDLLTLSQIETGQIKMRFEQIDLYALAEEVIEQFRSKVQKKDISLRLEGPVRKIPALGDALRIGQVLTNLISNAIQYSDEGSEVVVSFSVRKKSVITSVRDSGEGIPAEHISRIFERFYRVDKSRSREKGGTGLGLAIVKHILDNHDSRAEVKSEPGKGSTFSFKLPRIKKGDDEGSGEDYGRTKD